MLTKIILWFLSSYFTKWPPHGRRLANTFPIAFEVMFTQELVGAREATNKRVVICVLFGAFFDEKKTNPPKIGRPSLGGWKDEIHRRFSKKEHEQIDCYCCIVVFVFQTAKKYQVEDWLFELKFLFTICRCLAAQVLLARFLPTVKSLTSSKLCSFQVLQVLCVLRGFFRWPLGSYYSQTISTQQEMELRPQIPFKHFVKGNSRDTQ